MYSSADSEPRLHSASSYGSARGASGELFSSAISDASSQFGCQNRVSFDRRLVDSMSNGSGRCRSFDSPAVMAGRVANLRAATSTPGRVSMGLVPPGIHLGLMPQSPLLWQGSRAGMPEHAIGGSPSEEDTMSESSEEAEVAELQGGPSQSDSLEAQWEECIKLLKMAGPLAIQSLLNQACFYISQAFAGHLGRLELSVAVLATSILNVTGFVALMGLASAMETLCAQAYGAGSYRMVGVMLQRALLVCCCAIIALVPIWIATEPLLRAIGQEAELSRLAARYVQLSIPSLFFSGIAECTKRYLMCQGIVVPTALATAVSTCAAPAINWALIYWAGLGLDGAAYANDVVFFVTAAFLTLYVMWYHHQIKGKPYATWQGWSSESFSGWGGYLRIAVPTSIMVSMEWWVVEVIVILAGLLPDPALSVSVTGICINIMNSVYMLSYGLSGAASTRVGNALGGGRPRAARRTAIVSGGLSLIATIICALGIIYFSHDIAHVFTSDAIVRRATSALAPLLAVVVIGDGLNAAFSGIIRGAARQKLGVTVNLFAYWAFGMPLMVVLAFPFQWGVRGFWAGMAVMCSVQGIILAAVSLHLDWAAESRRAIALIRQSSCRDTEAPPQLEPLLPLQPHEQH